MSPFVKYFFLIIVLVSMSSLNCQKNNDSATPQTPANFTDRILTQNLNSPWEILWGPDNFIWMTQKGGQVSRVNPANGTVTNVYLIPDVQSQGEGGLLGMVLHPNFSANPYVYVSYNYNSGGSYKEKIVRFTYNGTTLSSPLILLDNIAAAGIHNGSRLVIIGDKLFVSTGDASNQALPQNTSSVNGKILRINLDGSIPNDNPIANSPVWSWGHRNPQGLVIVGSKLYSSEHGPSTDDEINVIEKGRNYGWPNVHGLCNSSDEQSFCTANNVKEPITAWTPTIAVSGMDYYNADYIPQWKNSLLIATLKNSRLYQVKLNDPGTEVVQSNEFFNDKYGRLRDVCIASDGKVYICTGNGSNDKIIVVEK